MRTATTLVAAAISAMATLCSCTHYVRNLPPSTVFDGQNEDALIVLKVEPVARISMMAGAVDRTGWSTSSGQASYAAWAEDGIIFIKVKPRTGRESYGVTVVTPDDGRYRKYQAGLGKNVPSFHATAGQITFVGALRIERSEAAGAVSVSHNEAPDDGELVAQFIKKHYPYVRAKLVTEIFDMYPRTDEPPTETTIIVVPALR